MPVTLPVVNIFLSSPGDVTHERECVRHAVFQANGDPFISQRCIFHVVAWDSPGASVPLSANQTPQSSVNEYVMLPRNCDLTVVILWGRLGTPLPEGVKRVDGSSYESGTVWELEDALSNHRPVWIYRKTSAPHIALDDPHFDKKRAAFSEVARFEDASHAADGSIRFGINHFANEEELRLKLSEHLRMFVSRHIDYRKDAVDHPGNEFSSPIVSAVNDAVSRIALDAAAPSQAPGTQRSELHDLYRYPIGPMVRDIVVDHLSMDIAERLDGENPRMIFAQINTLLQKVRIDGDPILRISIANFSTSRGDFSFWTDVLHWAAVQGPRMLAAVLSIFDRDRVTVAGRIEMETLIERVNSYVE
ncbi:hypothetical protein [Paraburkholderia hospita]|uniref:hypothetical protein n=1 Tax=Paraburkholderia hospita TaxID=169430 RepID=UPI003ECE78D8